MKKALVYGLGISGKGAKNMLEEEGYKTILVDDKNGISSNDALAMLDDIDVFVKSPGIPYNDLLKLAIKKEIKIIDEIELAYNYMIEKDIKSKIIAITGTNGKTTTTSKIAELLNFAGYKARHAGNIGVSFANLLLENKDLDYIVLELSSFQLENIYNFKPFISMIINLIPDHTARYDKIEDYYDTKLNISKNQDEAGYFILNIDDAEIMKRSEKIKCGKVKISKLKELPNGGCYVKDGEIFFGNESIVETEKLSLKGSHNIENTLFIIATVKILGIENDKIKEFLYNTLPLEHRMERFFNYGKVLFVNDSKATNIHSTSFALEAYKDCILICGGYDKDVDLNPLGDLIKENVKEVYLIGNIAENIKKILIEKGYPQDRINFLGTIENSLKDLKEKLSEDKEEVVLLSPATSSYDQFKSFEDRGKQFKKMVEEIYGR